MENVQEEEFKTEKKNHSRFHREGLNEAIDLIDNIEKGGCIYYDPKTKEIKIKPINEVGYEQIALCSIANLKYVKRHSLFKKKYLIKLNKHHIFSMKNNLQTFL